MTYLEWSENGFIDLSQKTKYFDIVYVIEETILYRFMSILYTYGILRSIIYHYYLTNQVERVENK